MTGAGRSFVTSSIEKAKEAIDTSNTGKRILLFVAAVGFFLLAPNSSAVDWFLLCIAMIQGAFGVLNVMLHFIGQVSPLEESLYYKVLLLRLGKWQSAVIVSIMGAWTVWLRHAKHHRREASVLRLLVCWVWNLSFCDGLPQQTILLEGINVVGRARRRMSLNAAPAEVTETNKLRYTCDEVTAMIHAEVERFKLGYDERLNLSVINELELLRSQQPEQYETSLDRLEIYQTGCEIQVSSMLHACCPDEMGNRWDADAKDKRDRERIEYKRRVLQILQERIEMAVHANASPSSSPFASMESQWPPITIWSSLSVLRGSPVDITKEMVNSLVRFTLMETVGKSSRQSHSTDGPITQHGLDVFVGNWELDEPGSDSVSPLLDFMVAVPDIPFNLNLQLNKAAAVQKSYYKLPFRLADRRTGLEWDLTCGGLTKAKRSLVLQAFETFSMSTVKVGPSIVSVYADLIGTDVDFLDLLLEVVETTGGDLTAHTVAVRVEKSDDMWNEGAPVWLARNTVISPVCTSVWIRTGSHSTSDRFT